MKTIQAHILKDGQPLGDMIELTTYCINPTPRNPGHWAGTFKLPPGIEGRSLISEKLQIRLADGSTGEILVHATNGTAVEFMGMGAPPPQVKEG